MSRSPRSAPVASLPTPVRPPVYPLPAPGPLLDAQFAAPSWNAWRVFERALRGEPLTPAEAEVYARHTGRTTTPAEPVREAWVIVGRRGGKSRIAARLAVERACRDYRAILAPGETGVVMVVAGDRTQARVVLRYIVALSDAVPALRGLVAKRLKESVLLRNNVVIEVHTSSFRRVRGHTVLAAILDEIAFWPSDESSANPDKEVVGALRPAMATVPGALLLAISTPYAKRGELHRAHERHYGRDSSPVLVWRGTTRDMNPTVPESVVAAAYEDDPAAAAAEFGAEFRTDIESFLPLEAVTAVVVPGRRELPPAADTSYAAFVDPSGGSQDAFTLAIAHRADDRCVVDAVREVRPPFSPDDVVREYCELLASYDVATVTGDCYGGEWPRERFAVHGVTYEPAPDNKSALYRALLPAVNSGRVELLDHARLTAQLTALERRVARGGNDSIDHPPGGHDDLANVVAGVCGLLLTGAALPPWDGW